ncbi:MAG: O-antigen ligase family protein [Caldimonas sp.]
MWFAVTAAAFLAHDYWIFAIAAGTLLAFGGAKDSNPIAFYAALLCAVPPLGSTVSGLGVINYFFDLNYLRLLSLVVLLPAAWRLFYKRGERLPGPKVPDALVGGYLLLLLVLAALSIPFTSALRQAFYLFIDVWLVYYVASRSVRDLASFRDVAAAFVIGSLIMALIALFEAGRGWLLYSPLDGVLGVNSGYGNYMSRGVGGPLRVMASTGHPIVMGYLMVVTIPLLIYLKPTIRPAFIPWLGVAALVGALIATLSRGPWVGAVAMSLVVVVVGKGASKRFGMLLAGLTAVAGVMLLFGRGQTLFDMLPFVGSVGSESVEYRKRLFEVSMRILGQSPVFGSPQFYGEEAAQELRGEGGGIDVVNTYVRVALSSGVVGLTLFVGLFASASVLAWRTQKFSKQWPAASSAAHALLAAIAGILVTIATTSSVSVIPPIYFMFVGLTVGWCGQCLAIGSVDDASDPADGAAHQFASRLRTDAG